jgi:hypothetical protein
MPGPNSSPSLVSGRVGTELDPTTGSVRERCVHRVGRSRRSVERLVYCRRRCGVSCSGGSLARGTTKQWRSECVHVGQVTGPRFRRRGTSIGVERRRGRSLQRTVRRHALDGQSTWAGRGLSYSSLIPRQRFSKYSSRPWKVSLFRRSSLLKPRPAPEKNITSTPLPSRFSSRTSGT